MTFSAIRKRTLIDNLATRLEGGEITLSSDATALINELEVDEYEQTAAGTSATQHRVGFMTTRSTRWPWLRKGRRVARRAVSRAAVWVVPFPIGRLRVKARTRTRVVLDDVGLSIAAPPRLLAVKATVSSARFSVHNRPLPLVPFDCLIIAVLT